MVLPACRACTAGLEPGKDARFVERVLARQRDDNLLVWIFRPQSEGVLAHGTIFL
jgi:hypothetical protein